MLLGTRGSALALAQSRLIAETLGDDVELSVIRTEGDRDQRPIRELGDGVFVVAIERALLDGRIDLAVHSLKDLPTEETPGLTIAAIPRREDARDVLITRSRAGLASLPQDAVVGTSSPRRTAVLQALRPDVRTREIRGNVDTRIGKVERGEFDGVMLAAAGLRRLGFPFSDSEALDLSVCPPAPGQGALAIQVRSDNVALREQLAALDHEPTRAAVVAERALLRLLGASCELALGAFARVEAGAIVMDAALLTAGALRRVSVRGDVPEAAAAKAAAALA